jgi:type IV secretion system protein VirB5
MFFAATMMWLAAQNKVIPYIVQVDNQGFTVAIRPAEAASAPDQRVVIATLGRFIMDLRTVVMDSGAQRRLIDSVYAHTASGSAAETTVSIFFRENNPFDMGRLARNVQIRTVMPHEAGTNRGMAWLVLWTENVTDSGTVVNSTNWRAIIQIAISPMRELEEVLRNPLGIYVTDLNMARDII